MNRLYAPSAIPLLSSERVGIQGKVGNISVMTVAISRIDDVEYNNTMHSGGQGRGICSFYQVWCLIAFLQMPVYPARW